MNFGELFERILTAQEEMLKHEIEENTVILNGKKYGLLLTEQYRPSIFGMAVETASLPDDYDFVVQFVEPKPQTNADKIRSMSDEELAEALYMGCGDRNEYTCKISKTYDELNLSYMSEEEEDAICIQCWLDWLKQEVDE